MAELDTYLGNLAGLVAGARQGLNAAMPGGSADSTSLIDSVPRTPTFAPAQPQPRLVPGAAPTGQRPARGQSTSLAGLGQLSPAEAWIIQHESGGNVNAWNPTAVVDRGVNMGHAFGVGQLVDTNRASYARQLGIRDPNTTNPGEQLAMFRLYVKQRYGTAERAQQFWQGHGWY